MAILAMITGLCIPGSAQELRYKQGEVILCFHPGTDQRSIERKYARHDSKLTEFRLEKNLSSDLNIWKASFDFTKINQNDFINLLKRDDAIAVAQVNHLLKRRSLIPDDPLLEEQWQWINQGERGSADADIDAEEAWTFSTGGVSRLGDTIVVAVIDVGVDYMHEDLDDNIWMNRNEIPGNRIDDDGNGYIDDVRGWNVLLENDNIEPELFAGGEMEEHGTEILGVVGAVGNNGKGVTGINWNVKMMNIFFNNDLNEADMIAAYGYVLAQRKLYNETDGAKGAYVVATNLSYGDEDLSPEETPIWCSIYDSLGRYGILNCTATANTAIDIDSIKDVPTSCSSDFMIAVTATDRSDERTFAAYGKNDIDLAAPGSQIYTTSIPEYTDVRGTSFSAPMVAGAIALLYASPCADLATMSKDDPAGAALMARSLILDHVDKIESLSEEVSSGGRLNIFNSISQTVSQCLTCIAPFEVVAEAAGDSAIINWQVSDSVTTTSLLVRTAGDTTWTIQLDSVASPMVIADLIECNAYEFMLVGTCMDGTTAETNIMSLIAENCCAAVDAFAAQPGETNTTFTWNGSPADEGYLLLYRQDIDTVSWDSTIVLAGSNSATIQNLSSCSAYQALLQTFCTDGAPITDTLTFSTLGCGTCLDSNYCELTVNAVGDEWIEQIVLNTIDNQSGYDEGYGDYTGMPTQLKQGNGYNLTISAGTILDEISEYYYAWIDLNQNGVFDTNEQLYASDTASARSSIDARIVIPRNAPLGLTRLRVIMLSDPLTEVSPCNTEIDLGEAEDYCVEIIIDSLICPSPANIDTMDFQISSTKIVWENVDSSIAYVIRHRKMGEEEWMEAVDTTPFFEITDLEECSTYEVQVQAVCGYDTSGYVDTLVFETFCNTAVDDELTDISVNVSPNPFNSYFAIDIHAQNKRSAEMMIYQLDGRLVYRQSTNIQVGKQRIEITDVGNLPPGMYLFALQTKEGRLLRKLLKQ